MPNYYGLKSTRTGHTVRSGPLKGTSYRFDDVQYEKYLAVAIQPQFELHARRIRWLIDRQKTRLYEDLGRAPGKIVWVVRGPSEYELRNPKITQARDDPYWYFHVLIGRRDKWGRGMEMGIRRHRIMASGPFPKVVGRELPVRAPYANKHRRLGITPSASLKGNHWQPFGPIRLAAKESVGSRYFGGGVQIKHPGVRKGRYDFVRRNMLELDWQIRKYIGSQHFARTHRPDRSTPIPLTATEMGTYRASRRSTPMRIPQQRQFPAHLQGDPTTWKRPTRRKSSFTGQLKPPVLKTGG